MTRPGIRRQGLDDVKAIPILEVAKALGIRVKGTSALCPFLGHEDQNPSFSIYPADNRCWCHRCAKGGSSIDLVAYAQGVSVSGAIAWLRSQFYLDNQTSSPGILRKSVSLAHQARPESASTIKPNSDIYTALLEQCPLDEAATAYLTSRKFTLETIRYFKPGTLTNNVATTRILIARFGRPALVQAGLISEKANRICFIPPAIIFPFYVQGCLAYIQARALPGNSAARWLGLRGVSKPVYNHDVMRKSRSIYICEGVTDVMSIHQMGLAAIGVLGGTTALPKDVMKELRAKDIYIVPDRDAVGETMAQHLKAQLQRAGLSTVTKRLDMGGDVNERLMMRGPR